LGWRGGRQDIDRRTAQTQPPGKFIQPVAPARDDDQVVAIMREALGKGLADTGRGPGHDRAWPAGGAVGRCHVCPIRSPPTRAVGRFHISAACGAVA
jgi:hypothetical protein